MSTKPGTTKTTNPISALLTVMLVLICLPSTIYGSTHWILEMISPPNGPGPMPLLGKVFFYCFFLVVIAGRPMCLVAIILGLVVLVMRNTPIWLKVIASAFIVMAVASTRLVEAQAAHVRQ